MSSEAADLLSERVLRAVEQVGPGTVVSYGDIAEIVGTTARVVGAVMSQYGAEVAWWRVTNRDGHLPERLLEAARERWNAEGISFRERGCRIDRHRADLAVVEERYREAIGSL